LEPDQTRSALTSHPCKDATNARGNLRKDSRAGVIVKVQLPPDLTSEEAEKVARVVLALARINADT